MLITYGIKPNPYLRDVIPKKSTAQPMDKDGNFPGTGKEKIAILLLGAKSNHPLGIFAPDFRIMGDFNSKMYHELETADNQDSGCKPPNSFPPFSKSDTNHVTVLGQTQFTRQDANGANEFITISYWRSIDDVHAYAHTPLHREAWKWWESTLKKHNYMGIHHEVFEADRGMWESLYVNFQPTLLGATTFLKRGGTLEAGAVADEWVSPLLEANRGFLRTSVGRRGQTHAVADRDTFGANPYLA
jgi:hypothetical protein